MYYNENHPPCRCGCGELADECAGPAPRPLGSMTVTATFDRPLSRTYRLTHATGARIDTFSREWAARLTRDALGAQTPTTALYRVPGDDVMRLRIADATPAQLATVEAAFAQSHIPFTLAEV